MFSDLSLKTIFFYLLIILFFGFLSYKLVLWIRHSLAWKTYVVQSGSMEPSIMTGDMIIIKKESSYQKSDVITFKDFNDRTVTHRIMETKAAVGNANSESAQTYVTKGDANQDSDTGTMPQERVIGKVVQVIPKFGYVVQFIKSPWGFILCIIAPAILIIYDEVRAVFEEARPVRRRRQLPH